MNVKPLAFDSLGTRSMATYVDTNKIKHRFKLSNFPKRTLVRFHKRNELCFPVDFWTVEGGELLGDIFTDGSYQSDGQVIYTNSDATQIAHNLRTVNRLFAKGELTIKVEGDNPQGILRQLNCARKSSRIYYRVRLRTRTKCFEVNYSKILSLFLDKLSIPKGDRTILNPSLPLVVMRAPDEVISAFLRRVITNEGCVTHDGQICIRQVVASVHKVPKLLKGYRYLFRRLGIKTTNPRVSEIYEGKYGHHVVWEVYTRTYCLSKVVEDVGIETSYKLSRAINFLKKKQRFRLTRGERRQEMLSIMRSFQNKFTINDVLQLTDLKRSAVQDYFYRLMRRGLIVRVNKRNFYPGGSEPYFYGLVRNGVKT